MKGINLITLSYTDVHGRHLSINVRGYDKSAGQTKNDYFQDMLDEVLAWLSALESNRTVSLEQGQWVHGQKRDLPDDGLTDWLKPFGHVKLFWRWLKDQPRSYVIFLATEEQPAACARKTVTEQHDKHWHIEQYQCAIKQVCTFVPAMAHLNPEFQVIVNA